MPKRRTHFDWSFDEAAFCAEGISDQPPAKAQAALPVVRFGARLKAQWTVLLCALLLLASGGWWLWQKAQTGIDQIEVEVSDAAQLEMSALALDPGLITATEINSTVASTWRMQLEREQSMLRSMFDSDLPASKLSTTLDTVNRQGDLAIAQIVIADQQGKEAYRQTRFYRQMGAGWVRIAPQAELWGAPHTLESIHFVFHFRQNDARIVSAAAPELDTLYTKLQQQLGLRLQIEKPVIDLSIENPTGVVSIPLWDGRPWQIASPAAYLAPAELSDEALLMQSIALPLVALMMQKSKESYAIPPHWRPFLSGLQLWQLWETGLPLAQWQDEVVTWLRFPKSAAESEQAHEQSSGLPSQYGQLCATYQLWMLSPALLAIPLKCDPTDAIIWSRQASTATSLPRLAQLEVPFTGSLRPGYPDDHDGNRDPDVVTVATLIDYAVDTYGVEQLPALLGGMARYENWETLIPAVYGISSQEFEQGWQAHLLLHYGNKNRN